MTMPGTDADVIDALAEITPGSPLSAIRARRPEARAHAHVDGLRRSGLDDLAIADVIHAAAFFNWANRLMLSLGQPAATAGP
jgi:hypothetical protein